MAEYLGLFAEYLDFVFTMGGKIEKSHGGTHAGPRGGADAGERSEQPNPRYSAKNNVAIL